jgi:hypothetical protein
MENSKTNELFLKGAKSFISENFKEAVSAFTQDLEEDNKNFGAYLYRASANIELGNYSEALTDLEEAEKTNPKSFEVFYKKGIAAFKLEKYILSSESFKTALSLASHSEQREKLILWTNKVNIEIEENNLLQKFEPQSKVEVDTSKIKIIHSWYQTPAHVIISLDSNTVLSKDSFDFVLEKKNAKIICKSSGTTVWEMSLSNSILPESSVVTANNNKKAELKLKKEIDHFNWVTVDRARVSEVTSNFQPSYPTSSKVKKDWNNLEKEINQELADDAKNDPNEGMMRLFKEIYGNATEETRRAMVKSFQTSGGTVLSTNWDEVKEKDYEGRDRPEAPKGQEWKKNEI